MQDKVYVILAYALIGLSVALWPLWVTEKAAGIGNHLSPRFESRSAKSWFGAVTLSIAAIGVMQITRESILSPLILGCGLIALAASRRDGSFDFVTMLASFLAVCVSATLPWWRRESGLLDISIGKLFAFVAITIIVTRSLTRESAKESGSTFIWVAVYTSLAAILSFSTGIFNDSNAFLTLWHHWGAYVGPSELLVSGAKVFYDFPVQYGLGPTSLIAGLCAKDCWKGMYLIAGSATFIFAVIHAILAFTLSRDRWTERIAILAACLATFFFWTAYPPDVASPLATPSVSGLRFLPAVVLAAYLFFSPSIEFSKPRMFVAHTLWAVGALWSPESAFYVTFLWWPYYLFIHQRTDAASAGKSLVRAAVTLLMIGAAWLIMFSVGFRLINGDWPTPYAILAYTINPPGPMPINPRGAVWYFVAVATIGLFALVSCYRTAGDTLSFRRGYLLQLLCYAAFSYFLGRSHDNNLLNILPFAMLVLLHAMTTVDSKMVASASVVLFAVLLGWLPLFGWHAWEQNLSAGKLLTFNPKALRDASSFANPDTAAKISERFVHAGLSAGQPGDAQRAIDFIDRTYGEPTTVLDYAANLLRASPSSAWSAIHNPANFAYIPADRRQEFLQRTAASLNRTGWLVVDRKFPAAEWLTDFDSVYDRTNTLEFGTYYAIRFSPKTRHRSAL